MIDMGDNTEITNPRLFHLASLPRASAEAPAFTHGEEAQLCRLYCVPPLAGCRFWWERPNPTGKRRVKVTSPGYGRYASHARHWLDPVCLFSRQVRDAWSWPRTPG